MARFGLADDSDEDEGVEAIDRPQKQSFFTEKASKGKGKAREVSPPMEADELAIPQRRQQAQPSANALVEDAEGEYRYAHESRPRERVASSDEDSEGMEREERVPAPTPWPSRIGMEPHKIHVMQASFFRAPEQEAAMKAANQKASTAGKSKPRLQADRLLNVSARLARKHSRGSDMGGEAGMLPDRAQRTTFYDSLDPVPNRPTGKFTRVLGAKSVSVGQEGSYVDAGLAFGRSFRVSWGPGGQLARIGGPSSSVINVDVIPMAADDETVEKIRSSRLLQVHLKHSTIEVDDASVPVAFPSRSLTFSTFASLFPKHDNCHEAQVWRQGVAIFDPPVQEPTSAYIPPAMKHRIIAVQRRTALSEWLASTVAPTVANALRAETSTSSAQKVFTRLAGYQVEEAIEDASAEGNVRLAILISQAGGDAEFRADLEDQLTVWATEGADQFVSEAYRKCVALLAGVTHVWHSPRKSTRGESGDVNVVKGLDWKRTFGLALWYGEGSEGGEGYEGALHQYEQNIGQDGVARPLPWYIEDPAQGTASSPSSYLSTAAVSSTNARIADEADALFELLRLATAATPLECAIYPRAFSANRLDYRLPWHLYILLSRAMRLKDFSDRQNSFDDLDLDVEGRSEMADDVTCAYAAQLEAIGQLQEAAFVLLHLEGSYGREKAIKELLMRQAHLLESWQIFGLTSLRIPMEWIEEAQACLSQYEGKSFDSYEHFLKADEQRMAHDIAVNDLAPDAVVRGDLSLLRALFKPFDPQAVPEWSFRGKLFLDYADATEKIPGLVAASQEDAVLDATDAAELERLKTLVPQLIRLLPDALRDRCEARQNTALSEMLSGLLLRLDSIKSKPAAQPRVDSRLVDEATRLRHIHSTAYDRFILSISAVA